MVAVQTHSQEEFRTWIPPRFSSSYLSFCCLAGAAGTAEAAGIKFHFILVAVTRRLAPALLSMPSRPPRRSSCNLGVPNEPRVVNGMTCDADVGLRQIAGAFAQLEKARLVAKLRVARERKRKEGLKVEGRKSLAESRPVAVEMARRLSCHGASAVSSMLASPADMG